MKKQVKQVKHVEPVKAKRVYKQDKLNTMDIKHPTKSLKFLRVVYMIAKVVSMIIFVLAIIGTVAGIVLAVLFISQKDTVYSATRTFETWWWTYTNGTCSVYTASLACIAGALCCAGAIAIGWLAWKFFGNIYRNGTPFTYKSAREAVRLAIVCGGTMLVGATIWGIFAIIYAVNFNGSGMNGLQPALIGYPFWYKLVFGCIYTVISFLFRHGAQVREMNYAKPLKPAKR